MSSQLLSIFQPISTYKVILAVLTKGVFRTQSNINNKAFFRKKSSIVDF